MDRVLIADDDAPIRELLARALAGPRLDVETAADGAEALAKLRASPPDLLLLDLMMPEVDGFDVLRALRADPRTRATQVVVVTARVERADLSAAFTAGADDFVVKPFDLVELQARVRAQLRMARFRRVLERRRRDAEVLLDISRRLTRHPDIQGILRDITGIVAEELGADRCSVVLIDGEADGAGSSPSGRVVAASDDAGLTDRVIALADYPEIRRVVSTRAPVIVDDPAVDPLFDPVKAHIARLSIRSVALFPMLEGDRCIGVLFLRSVHPRAAFGDRESQFGSIVANATAVAVTNARLFSELAEREKLRVLAEVAGAAAHELNQPLTSVMGYAELLERRVGEGDALVYKAAQTIQRETGRMADIVRRIGQLTRYETRSYVGGLRILDLDASIDPLAQLDPPTDEE